MSCYAVVCFVREVKHCRRAEVKTKWGGLLGRRGRLTRVITCPSRYLMADDDVSLAASQLSHARTRANAQ